MVTLLTLIWLLIIVGGVFVSSNSFMNVENDVKLYITSISAVVIIAVLSLSKRPLYYLKQCVTNKLFLYGLTVICFALSIQGLLQYVGILSSNHYNFSITGCYENPAGYSSILSLLFIAPLFIAFEFGKTHKSYMRISLTLVLLLAFVMMILCGSRSGILSMLATLLIMIFYKTDFLQTLKKHKWLNLLLLFIIIALLFLLYLLKADSANGRLLIWRVCMDMIADRPLFGFGHGGFLANYMQYQAEYLSLHPDSPLALLADNMNHPFNEYIKLTIEYGVFVLLLALILLYIVVKNILKQSKTKSIGLSVVATVVIQSMFSYPFNYAAFILLTALLLIYSIPINEPSHIKPYRYITAGIGILSVLTILLLCARCYYDMKWAAMSARSLKGESERMLPHYEKMLTKLGHNPYFLYNYSAELNYTGRYKDSNEIALLCQKKLDDYDVQLLLADNYTNMHQYDKAIESYRTASDMVPSRFVPLESIMDIYLIQGDTISATKIADEITAKPVKVKSATVDGIKMRAKDLVNKMNREVDKMER